MSARPNHMSAIAALFALTLGALPVVAAETPTAPSASRSTGDVAASDAGILRRLPSIGRDTRLAGETDTLAFPVWMSEAEVARAPRLRLAWTTAVSVMPEASTLSVLVNGRRVAGFRIAGTARSIDLPLPADALRSGWNAVTIEADQRHRVECTVASTWELWTDIDRARSGLVFDAAALPQHRGFADIAGLSPDEQGRVHIRLVLPDQTDALRMQRAVRLAEAAALAGGFLDPIVTVTRTLDKAPGLDLVVGRAAADLVDSGGVGIRDTATPDRLVLVVPSDDEATVDRTVAELTEIAATRDGSDTGRALRDALGGRLVASGDRLSLADLGLRSTEFSGRLFHTSFDLRLPADLYAADYAKVAVRLFGGHAAGLDRADRLTIRVNGRQAAGSPIVAPRGEVFTDRVLQVPLSAFKPGHNRVEVEASLADATDRACDPAVQIDAPKRFLLLDRTEIVFPTFARIARLPDLSATAAGVLSSLAEDRRPTVFVPHPDAGSLSAAATFLTRTAVAAGRVDAPRFSWRTPNADTPSATVFAAFGDLPANVATNVGLEPGLVRDAWGRRPTDPRVSLALPSDDHLARRVIPAPRIAGFAGAVDPTITGSLQGRTLAPLGAPEGELVDRWRRSVESPWSPAAFTREVGERVGRALELLPGHAAPRAAFSPTPSTGLVVAQATTAAGGVWTLVTAPSTAVLGDAVATVTSGDDWTRMAGAVTAWDRTEDKIDTLPASGIDFLSTRAFDIANLRLVAAAWACETPIGFALAVLLATCLLGLATARMIPHIGGAKAK